MNASAGHREYHHLMSVPPTDTRQKKSWGSLVLLLVLSLDTQSRVKGGLKELEAQDHFLSQVYFYLYSTKTVGFIVR